MKLYTGSWDRLADQTIGWNVFHTTGKHSIIPTRLVSPYPGVDFLGRVEVFYRGLWGTICGNSFSTPEANLVCHALNFTDGTLCVVYNARYGRGTGRKKIRTFQVQLTNVLTHQYY